MQYRQQKSNYIVKGVGTPVVLLHSTLSSKIQWFELMDRLASDYFLVAPDFTGYGDAPPPPVRDRFGLMNEIEYLESVLDTLLPPDEPFHLVGHSYGGAVGLRYCLKAPERVRSLTLFEPVCFHVLPEGEEASIGVHRTTRVLDNYLSSQKYSEAVQYFIDLWSGAGTFMSFPPAIRDTFMQNVPKLQLDNHAVMEEPLSLEDYSKIKPPVCLIGGRRSPLEARRVIELLEGTLSDCRVKWIDAGHMAPIFRTDLVNPIIENFIRQLN